MALPYYTERIPYYNGISTATFHRPPCGMNDAPSDPQNPHRFTEDFNEYPSLDDMIDVGSTGNYPRNTIARSPIRTTFDRAQSERQYREMSIDHRSLQQQQQHPYPHYYHRNGWTNTAIDNDDSDAAMMLMIRNRTLKPAPKRSRRTHSAPQMLPFDHNDHNNNNDLLDLLDIDDDDEIRLTTTEDYSDSNYINSNKAVRSQSQDDINLSFAQPFVNTTASSTSLAATTSHGAYPFYSYVDHSQEVDMTPDVPLTAMGRVPTFLAKLHAILLRPELHPIVAWLPHGRSWKVYNAVEFEKQVIAVYFEFTKHPNSSFFRQAKLWGFLRIKQPGTDHDSYYHPRFLRGLPHLCKDVRRPAASQLPDVPPVDQEPNLTKISEMYPLPPSSNAVINDPTIRLDWFMKGKQQQQLQHQTKPDAFRYPPPGKEGIAKKTSSTTSVSTDYSTHSIVKRKRSTEENHQGPQVVSSHLSTEYDMEPIDVNVPPRYDNNFRSNGMSFNMDDDDDDEPPIDDDLGLNLDPYFSKGYHLYPFYDYVDYSTNADMYPLQPYTDIGQDPTFPIILHAMLLWLTQCHAAEPCIQWQRHGRAWKICSVTKLEAEVLPLFFQKHSSFGQNNHNNAAGSFFRHVTRWGFKRIDQVNSSDVGCYYHPKFLRGLPHLCKDWNMNEVPSASSISSTFPLLAVNDDLDQNEYPEPDLTKISQLHPVPDYDSNMRAEDLLGPYWLTG